jgi:hypothetical protein
MFGGALCTVWSAPNYCYRSGNLASVLTIDENFKNINEKDGNGKRWTVFGPAEENERDQAKGRRMVSAAFVFNGSVLSPVYPVRLVRVGC